MPRRFIIALGSCLWASMSLAIPPCRTNEAPVVACTGSEKQLLVCISEESVNKPKHVRYQFGSASRPELEVVAVPGVNGPQFRYSTQSYSRGSGFQARFSSGSYLYVVYDYLIGSSWPRQGHSTYMGVLVFRGSGELEAPELPAGKLLSIVQCSKRMVIEAPPSHNNPLDNLQYIEAASLPDEVWARLIPIK